MKIVKFSGSSDDNVCWEGRGVTDEVGGYDVTTFLRVAGGEEELYVVAHYCPGPASGWMLGVCRSADDDDVHLPAWPMHLERHPRLPYSPVLVIECPDDVTITPVDDRGREVPLTPAKVEGAIGELLAKQDALQQSCREVDRALQQAIGSLTAAKGIIAKASK